jgi:dsRNA-specific ribonuclease
MGWKQGCGLGKKQNGLIDPFTLSLKTDRKGLASLEDQQFMFKYAVCKPGQTSNPIKHPVSLLNEICSKKRWPEPRYELVSADGPAHLPMFKMRVYVLDKPYEPQNASPNKKQAKTDAAQACLRSLEFAS